MRAKAILCAAILLAPFVRTAAAEEITVGVTIHTNVVYGRVGVLDLLMDIAVPQGPGPYPAIVCIHGGGWRSGDKESFSDLIRELARNGYVAASVSYRLAPQFKFPSQVEDVKCAVRYLRAKAKEMKVDPTKIGAMGNSAGGHLALMLGMMNPEDGLEGEGGNADQSSKVQAVVNFYGPTDLTVKGWNFIAVRMAHDFLGTKDRKQPIVAKASPVTYIDKNDPPVKSFHASGDYMVPTDQARRLHAILADAGVEQELEVVSKLGHGWKGKELERTTKSTIAFFDRHLKALTPATIEKKPTPSTP